MRDEVRRFGAKGVRIIDKSRKSAALDPHIRRETEYVSVHFRFKHFEICIICNAHETQIVRSVKYKFVVTSIILRTLTDNLDDTSYP